MSLDSSKLPNSAAVTPRYERLADFLRYVRQFGVESVGDYSITVPTSADGLGHAMFSFAMFEQCIELLKVAEQPEADIRAEEPCATCRHGRWDHHTLPNDTSCLECHCKEWQAMEQANSRTTEQTAALLRDVFEGYHHSAGIWRDSPVWNAMAKALEPQAATESSTEATLDEEKRFSLEWSRDQLRSTQNAVRYHAARILDCAAELGQGSREPFVRIAERLNEHADRMEAPLKRLEAL